MIWTKDNWNLFLTIARNRHITLHFIDQLKVFFYSINTRWYGDSLNASFQRNETVCNQSVWEL